MSTSMLLGLFSWVGDFFKSLLDLIPKIIYLLYASIACVMDVLQLFFRKLAGLDVYYVDGKMVEGDLVTNFITGILGIGHRDSISYSALSTVFWSMVVFGVIICFACTIIAIIKSHYSYDEKAAKGPMQYVYTAGKAIINMVAVPIIVVLGLYVSEALLTALDTMTSTNSGTIVEMFGNQVNMLQPIATVKQAGGLEYNGALEDTVVDPNNSSTYKGKNYIRYDIFGFDCDIRYNSSSTTISGDKNDHAKIGAKTQPFSGSLFKVAAYNANRVRGSNWTNLAYTDGSNLFANGGKDVKKLADMVDTAFACNLLLKQGHTLNYPGGSCFASAKYFTNFLTKTVSSYSKFNVGLVWFYYDLWNFNFIVGFAGIIVCVSIFINVILGLITRLFMCIVLFLVAPPLFGLAPLDGGKAGKGWRENFMKQALMAYGAVVGMNLVMMILPYMNEIDFFNIAIADYFAQTLVIIVGLITIKAVIATLSGLIGAADANETGNKMKEEVGQVAGKATSLTIGAAKLGAKGVKAMGSAAHAVGHGAAAAGAGIKSLVNKHQGDVAGKAQSSLLGDPSKLAGINASDRKSSIMKELKDNGVTSRSERRAIANEIKRSGTTNAAALTSRLGQREINKGLASNKSAEFAKKRAASMGRNLSNAVQGKASSDFAGIGKAVANSKLGERLKAAKGSAVGQAIGTTFKGLGSNLKDVAGSVWDSVGKNDKFIETFAHESGIKKRPDWAKETAQNTGVIAENSKATGSMARRQKELLLQRWQSTHPGVKLTEKEQEKFDKDGILPP